MQFRVDSIMTLTYCNNTEFLGTEYVRVPNGTGYACDNCAFEGTELCPQVWKVLGACGDDIYVQSQINP